MTVTLTNGSNAGVFDRAGLLIGGWLDQMVLAGDVDNGEEDQRVNATASWETRLANLHTAYAASVAELDVLDGVQEVVDSWRDAQQGLGQGIQNLIQSTFIDMVDADTHLKERTLAEAVRVLIQQMDGASATINGVEPAVGAQASVGSPNGTAEAVVSVKGGDGEFLQYLFAETLRIRCTADSQNGGATEGQEELAVTGEAAADGVFDYRWPLGSGAEITLSATDGSVANSAGGNNLLENPDFQDFTAANNPDNWLVTVGAVGTNVLDGGSGNAYTPSGGSLQIAGDAGGTLTALTQKFGATPATSGEGGTAATLSANTVYHLSLWLKVSATPAAGVLTFELVDDTPAVLQDDEGNNVAFTKSLTASTTSFEHVFGSFVTPRVMPDTVKLRVRLSTAIDNGKSVYLGRVSMAQANQLYAGGPFVTVHSGDTKLVAGDEYTVAVSVTETDRQLARELQRFLDMRELGLQFPYDTAGAETVADSVIE